VTDSSDPRRPKSSRKKPSREPATLDLKATVIDHGTVQASPEGSAPGKAVHETAVQDTAAQDTIAQDTIGDEVHATGTAPADTLPAANAEETIASSSEPPAEDVVASPEASLDSGAGTDTLPSEAATEEPAGPDTLSSGTSYQDASPSGMRGDPVPPPPERRGSAGALLGSGLLGGLVGAGLVYGLQTWQAPPAQDDPRITQLEQRVNALRQPTAPGQSQGNTQALEGRIQALETVRGEIDQRFQAIQDSARQAASQAQEALNRPVPEAPPAQASPQNEAAIADLSSRLAALEEQVRSNAQNATNAANVTQELDRRIADLDRRFGEREQRFTELDRQLAETGRRFADADRRFGEQEQRLAALSQQAAESVRNAEAAGQTGTRVVLAGRLNDALQSGTPYAEVLDGVKKAGTDPSRIAPLEPFAQQGAPTAAELAQSFEPVETTILRESRGPAEGWTDRILRMADRVVTVRPVNGQDGTGVSALVARIRQALERGDVVEAAAAWDALPEPSRRLSEEWGRQVKAVAQAHQAVQGLSADALATLNRTTQ
jgi:hypothetical protein